MSWKKGLVLCALFGLLAYSAFEVFQGASQTAAGARVFQKISFQDALIQARKENKVVLLDFSTSWCGPCRRMDAETFSKAEVQEFLNEKTVPIRIDGDAQADMVDMFGVAAYPTFVFVDARGEELGRILGYVPPERFLSEAAKRIKE